VYSVLYGIKMNTMIDKNELQDELEDELEDEFTDKQRRVVY
jgi:hypothetical protein